MSTATFILEANTPEECVSEILAHVAHLLDQRRTEWANEQRKHRKMAKDYQVYELVQLVKFLEQVQVRPKEEA